ncbi:MAG: AAA family ATPase [Verrucomicrobiota bacterium]|nr:AAA family ATPase [Verrucomicrobiota bacterium]
MDELSLEKRLVNRILREKKSPQLEEFLLGFLESVREGHLCSKIDDPSLLPSDVVSIGDEQTPFPEKPLVLQENRLYLQRNWALESLIVHKAAELSSRTPVVLDRHRFEQALTSMQETLQPGQKKAIERAYDQMFSLFTGGPGTGKTYTAGCFIRLLAACHPTPPFKVVIAAPTGKAAAHLESSLKAQSSLYFHCESMTLHRLLKLYPGQHRFFSDRLIDADLVVVDEASMIDVSLMLHLLNSIGPETRLLLLGDPNQLPPVEAGSLFAEMAELLGHPLERSMRTADPFLLSLAEAIQKGDIQPIREAITPFPNSLIEELCRRLHSPIHSVSPDPMGCLQEQKRFRILCALRQGPLGVDALNRELIHRFERQLGPADWLSIPILITQNDPRRQLYNGTMGVLIQQARGTQGTAYLMTGDQVRAFPVNALPHFEAAFCLSVHKSQGSEFEEVMILFPPGSERFGKEALYTAVTRAKRKAMLMGDAALLEEALKMPLRKRSGFTERFLAFKQKLCC